MQEQIAVLYQAFNKFNAAKFDNRLPTPTITIQTKGNKSAIGWCSSAPRWQGPKEATYEINLCAEYAAIPFLDIMEVLLHEMTHLSNAVNDIKDCSRSGTYHNKYYKAEAQRVGLLVEKSKKYGWAHTKLTEETQRLIQSWKLNDTVFNNARMEKESGESKSSTRKYTCPECQISVRATKDVHVVCGECKAKMEIES